jgi:hypothetical protein
MTKVYDHGHYRPSLVCAVASGLAMRGYSTFLPLFRSRRQWSDRFQDIDLPLFPGYVFSRLDVNHRLPALLIPGVVRIVGLGKIPVPVDEEEMTAVQAIVESGLFMRPFPFLKIGQTVTIQSSAAVSRRRAPAQFCSAGGGRRRLGRTAARDRRLGRRLAGWVPPNRNGCSTGRTKPLPLESKGLARGQPAGRLSTGPVCADSQSARRITSCPTSCKLTHYRFL